MTAASMEEIKLRTRQRIRVELAIIIVLTVLAYVFSLFYDSLEAIVEFSNKYENWEIDEIFASMIALSVLSSIFLCRRVRDLHAYQRVLLERNAELQRALSEIKVLRGLIPICASCKKVRDEKGYWQQVESYIAKRSEALFSHSICPDCYQKLYADALNGKTGEVC